MAWSSRRRKITNGVARINHKIDKELVMGSCGLRGLTRAGRPDRRAQRRHADAPAAGPAGRAAGGSYTLDGDESIRRRPVDRITMPLRAMGAVLGDSDGRPPLHVDGGGGCSRSTTSCPSPRPRSSPASCWPGSGRRPDHRVEPRATRDHTERLLRAAGARVARRPRTVSVRPAEALRLSEIEVPGDISSAAPFIVAATLLPESHLFLRGVGVNPGRTGLLTVLERMGARIGLFNRRTTAGGEPVADIEVRHAELVATEIEPEIVPSLIDELPLIALAAARARGRTVVRGAEDLRKKESDRIATVAEPLRPSAPTSRRPTTAGRSAACRRAPRRPVEPHGDHRIAMMGAIAGLSRSRASACAALERSTSRSPASASAVEAAWRSAADGDHDRRPRRRRQVHGRARWSRAARLPLPRHRRDVPRGDAVRAAHAASTRGAAALAGCRRGRDAADDPACAARRSTRASRRSRGQPAVREAMREAQRAFLADGDAVAEGRDIGEVVWPQAELKVWLDAAPEMRARRRGSRATPPPPPRWQRDRRDSAQTCAPSDAVASTPRSCLGRGRRRASSRWPRARAA